ncbi:hypothetical protein HW130_26480 [Streptomyces sp. PKU-EA00015]|uniref:TrmB family transcriptional regulator n=1 Tax=Streptomyces sp. PKU-EA00015 TaxID=2748326 RepID=UPI0015A3A498|nr:hypothetical protein [Streptomyces sp. PKU-EA00015]NWF29762.1 hypothetical protein [Streptomyces sp. PKU-EA00015]
MLDLWEVEDTTAAVYQEMLRRPGIDLHGLRDSLTLDESEIRRALYELADLALVHRSWEETDSVQPLSPRLGLRALLARKRTETVRRQQAPEEARGAAGPLVDHRASAYASVPGMHVEHVQGEAAVCRRIAGIEAGAERELLSFASDEPRAGDDGGEGEAPSAARRTRPVTVRVVCPDHVRRATAWTGHAPGRQGAQIRTVPRLAFRAHIADGRRAVVQLNPGNTAEDALVIEEPAVVALLRSFFETVWASATPLGAGGEKDAITSQDRQLLRLLGQGLTDEAAARKLGVSLRTERRMLTKLSELLDAQSRFQLGQRAAERGLL